MPNTRSILFMMIGLVSLAPHLPGCWKACGVVGCLNGLRVAFAGGSSPGRTYVVEIATLTPTRERVALLTCSLTPSQGTAPLACSGALAHQELGTMLVIDDHPDNLIVAISAEGQGPTEQVFHPAYVTDEPNGAGCCCTCTAADVRVVMPST